MGRATKWLAAVAVVGGLGLTAQTASAQYKPQVATGYGANWYPPRPLPNPGPFPPRHDHDYAVYVLKPFRGWVFYGRFETQHQARRAEWQLERAGYRVRVETIHDHGPRPW